jgi:hypothetical protein
VAGGPTIVDLTGRSGVAGAGEVHAPGAARGKIVGMHKAAVGIIVVDRFDELPIARNPDDGSVVVAGDQDFTAHLNKTIGATTILMPDRLDPSARDPEHTRTGVIDEVKRIVDENHPFRKAKACCDNFDAGCLPISTGLPHHLQIPRGQTLARTPPRLAQVGPQGPPAPSLRCAQRALRFGAGPSYGLPAQSRAPKRKPAIGRHFGK